MRIPVPVGRYETARLKREKSVLHGNLKLVIFAGLSMEPSAKGMCRTAGRRRFNYVDNVRYFDGCYLLFETTGPQ